MNRNSSGQLSIINDFQSSYEEGYRCIFYETDERDQLFTVYLKNFDTENVKILKCKEKEGEELINYINKLN